MVHPVQNTKFKIVSIPRICFRWRTKKLYRYYNIDTSSVNLNSAQIMQIRLSRLHQVTVMTFLKALFRWTCFLNGSYVARDSKD